MLSLKKTTVINSSYESNIKPELYYVPVLHYVVLAFQADQPFFPGRNFAAAFYQIVIRNNFRFDKTFFKICMDLSRCLGALVPILMVQARLSISPAVR